MQQLEEWEQQRLDNAEEFIAVVNFFGISILRVYKDRHGYFWPWASGGLKDFGEDKILYKAKTREKLEKLAPEYFL